MKLSARTFFYFLLAVIAVTGTLFRVSHILASAQAVSGNVFLVIEGQNDVEIQKNGAGPFLVAASKIELQAGDVIRTNDSSGVTISLPRDGIVRIQSDSMVRLTKSESSHVYRFDIVQGELYANMQLSDASLTVVGGSSVLIADGSVFDAILDESKLTVFSLGGSVTAAFLRDGEIFPDGKILRGDERIFYNNFVVADGNRANLFASKIQPRIEKLLYSKLIKEFQYGKIGQSSLDSEWFQENLKRDLHFRQIVLLSREQEIREGGLNHASLDSVTYALKKGTFDVSKLFTFESEKRTEHVLDFFNAYIQDASYLILIGNGSDGMSRLDAFTLQFKNDVLSVVPSEDVSLVTDWLDRKIKDFRFAAGGHALFPVYDALRTVRLSFETRNVEEAEEKLVLIKTYLDDATALLETNTENAKRVLTQYFSMLSSFIASHHAYRNDLQSGLAQQNSLVTNVFYKHPVFYVDDLFSKKTDLENTWLSLLIDSQEKDEERQTMIVDKITLLNRLQEFFFQEKVSVMETRKIAFRLIRDINALIPVSSQQVAVTELFEKRLTGFGNFWSYLNSVYASSTVYGVTHLDRFSAFEKALKEDISIRDIRAEILGEYGATDAPVKNLSVEQIYEQIQEDFTAIGAKDIKFEPFKDPSTRYVHMQSVVLKGVKFSAEYDWVEQLVEHIFVNDSELFVSAVRLDQLESLLRAKLAPPPVSAPQIDEKPVVLESKTEKLARLLVFQLLVESGFDLKEDQISILNISKKMFHVQELITAGTQYSFDLQSDTRTISNVRVEIKGKELVMETSVTLENVASQVQKFVENEFLKSLEQETGVPGIVQ